MADPITMVNNALAVLQKLKAATDAMKLADVNLLVADLKIALADIKGELADQKEENLRLAQELRQALATKDEPQPNVEFRDDAYWYAGEVPTGRPPGPFCPRCFEAAKRLMTMKRTTGPHVSLGKWFCNECRSHYSGGTGFGSKVKA
jgi:hypothetical protein